MRSIRKKWFWHGTIGFLLIGSGLSIALDASARRIVQEDWWIWFGEGTIGLIVLMTGLAFFGSSVRYLAQLTFIR